MWAKVECFSAEGNCLVKVRYCPEVLVPAGEMNGKDVQRHRPISVSLWAEVKRFSVEEDGLIEVLYCPEVLVTSEETSREAV